MNKHKIAWIALAVGIVVVLMLTWLVGVSPRLTHIKEADAQTAQIEESNKKTRDQMRMASETIGLQKDRLRQLQRQIPDGYNQNEFIDSLNAAADGAGVSIQSVTFDEATTAEVPSEMQGTIKAGRLVQVPVSITANGSYDAMRGFVQAVQGINRIAVPEDVTYTLDKGGDATKNIEPMCLTRPDCIAIDENVDSSDKQYIKNDSLLIHYMGPSAFAGSPLCIFTYSYVFSFGSCINLPFIPIGNHVTCHAVKLSGKTVSM